MLAAVRQRVNPVTFFSEVGVGTEPGSAVKFPTGSETILLADDDPSVRTLTVALLGRWGYAVLQAMDGPQALQLSRERTGPIHLLLTDVVMPGMGGRALADTLARERPGLKVLFMSGYSDDSADEQGILEAGGHLLQKPFTPEGLARRVREVLDG